jgi:TRAP-type C4-dicarboxylate transport system substrate-binding protein
MFKSIYVKIMAALIGLSLMPQVHAAQRVIVGDPSPLTSIVGRALTVFKQSAEKYSNGDLQVQIFPSSQLGDFGRMATQMQIDQVNVMFIQPDALGQRSNIATANAWPFLFKNVEDMLKAWRGPGGQAVIAEVEKRSGYRMIAPSWNQPRWIYTSRDAHSLADLKGMKIRVPGTPIYVEQMKLLGMSPTPVNMVEVYTGMQQKVIEGVEGTIADMDSISVQDVAKTAVMSGHVLSPKAFLTMGRWVDSLTPANKAAFLKAAQDGSDAYGKFAQEEEQGLMKKFKDKGVKFVDPGVSFDDMSKMEEPLKTRLPEVWTWSQKLTGG